MSQHKGGRAAILAILVGGLGVGSLAYYVKSTPRAQRVPDAVAEKKPEAREEPSAHTGRKKSRRMATKTPTADTVRLPVFGDEISEMELAKADTSVPEGQEAMKYVAGRIAEAAHIDGARVLGVDVRDHVAFVNYDAAVQKGMGSMEEGAFLRALQIGFGQFTGIDRVAVESEGQPLQSGHVDLTEPMPVIRPGEKPVEDPKPVEP